MNGMSERSRRAQSQPIMQDYPDLARQCLTQNQFNRLHIDLERLLTPVEICVLGRLASATVLPQPSQAWLGDLKRLSAEMFVAPTPFSRYEISTTVSLFRDGTVSPSRKSLLVAFTGNFRRLMMPIAVFLQNLDPRSWDLILLRQDGERAYFPTDGRDLPDVMSAMLSAGPGFRPTDYRRVVTIGTSGGGFPAIVAAIVMGASRGVSISGRMPRERPMPSADGPPPDLIFVYGERHPVDRDQARSMQGLFAGRLRPVAGVAEHNVLYTLLQRGQLALFLAEVLG